MIVVATPDGSRGWRSTHTTHARMRHTRTHTHTHTTHACMRHTRTHTHTLASHYHVYNAKQSKQNSKNIMYIYIYWIIHGKNSAIKKEKILAWTTGDDTRNQRVYHLNRQSRSSDTTIYLSLKNVFTNKILAWTIDTRNKTACHLQSCSNDNNLSVTEKHFTNININPFLYNCTCTQFIQTQYLYKQWHNIPSKNPEGFPVMLLILRPLQQFTDGINRFMPTRVVEPLMTDCTFSNDFLWNLSLHVCM